VTARCGIAAALTLAATAMGCAASTTPACSEARIQFDGQCCPPWSVADLDVCVPTVWTEPTTHVSQHTDGSGSSARDPAIAVDGALRAVVAWTSSATTGTEPSVAVAAEDANGDFAVIAPGAALAGTGSTPSLATDADGHALVSWVQTDGDHRAIHYAERDTDDAWSLPPDRTQLSFGPEANAPHSRYSAYGEATIVYGQSTEDGFGVALARRGADISDEPLVGPADASDLVSPPGLWVGRPRIAIASNGDAIISGCPTTGSAPLMVVAERFGPDGSFANAPDSAPTWLAGAQATGAVESCAVPAIDDRGAAAIAWTQPNAAGGTPVFVATRTGWGQWTTPAGLDDALSDPSSNATGLDVAFGGNGSLHLTWSEQDATGPRRVLWTYRTPGGVWSEPTVLSAAGFDAHGPALAVGDEGEALVAYVQRHGDGWHLVTRRRNPDDAAWLDPEVLSEALEGDARQPSVAWREATFVVAWVHGAARQGRVYLARVTPQAPDDTP